MACRNDNEQLSLYIDNLLSEDDAALIKAHLKTCNDCTQKVTLYRLIPSAIDAPKHIAPPPDFTKVVMQRIALAQLNITSFNYDSSSTVNGRRTRVQVSSVSVETVPDSDDDDELDAGNAYRPQSFTTKSSPNEQHGINFSKIFGLTPSESLLNGSAPVYGKASEADATLPANVVPLSPNLVRRAALTYALRFSGVAAALVFMVGVGGAIAGISSGSDGGDQAASSRNIFMVTRLAAIAFSSPILALGALGVIAAVLGCIALYTSRNNRRLTS